MPSRIRPFLTAVAAVAALAAAGPTQAVGSPGLVRVSGPSPYGDCATSTAGGTMYTEAEVEPMVAVNPADPGNLVGVWQQDRWSNGGAHGLAAGWSFDGGRHWGRTTLPFSRCAPGGLPYKRASDPWVSIGGDGTAYAVGLSFSDRPQHPTSYAVSTATSTDGGRTWGTVRRVVDDPVGSVHSDDKESITADPTHAGVAYLVWDRTHRDSSGQFHVPAVFSKTTDGGQTWSPPMPIAANRPNDSTIGNVIVVDPASDVLYDFYGRYPPARPPRIEFVKSADGGAHWSAPHSLGVISSNGVFDPNTDQYIRTLDFAPTVAIDPQDGSLHVAWQTSRFGDGSYDEIGITRSTDGGQTWSPLRRANVHTGRAAFTPTLAVSSDGTVGLSYYDFRRLNDVQEAVLPTDYWLRTSADGGRTFGPEQHIAGPFDMRAAPRAGGFFVGDYQGLASAGTTFVAFFAQANCATGPCQANRTDVYASRLVPLPTQ